MQNEYTLYITFTFLETRVGKSIARVPEVAYNGQITIIHQILKFNLRNFKNRIYKFVIISKKISL